MENYQILHILLKESQFSRKVIIDLNDKENDHDIKFDVETSFNKENDHLQVLIRLSYKFGSEKDSFIDAQISFIGTFLCPKQHAVPVEIFEKLNAPAIIFPFVREHLASLTIKAMLPPIFLPSFNFSKIGEEDQNIIKDKTS